VLVRRLPFRSDGLDLAVEVCWHGEPRALLVLCHGAPSGEPPDPEDPGYAGFAAQLAGRGYAAAWFAFRGAHGMPGEVSMAGWVADAGAALNALTEVGELRVLPRVLVGSSLGGATAIVAASRRPDAVAVATFAAPSWPEGGAGSGESGAGESGAGAEAFVASISPRPLLLVHGDADDVVPYQHAERLFALAGEPKELVRIPGGGHRLRRDPRAVEALVDWLDRRRFGPFRPDTSAGSPPSVVKSSPGTADNPLRERTGSIGEPSDGGSAPTVRPPWHG